MSAADNLVTEFRTVNEGNKEPLPSVSSDPPAFAGSEVVRASLLSSSGSRSNSGNSLSRSSSQNRSRKEMLALKGQAVGALPRGASQDEMELEEAVDQAGTGGSGDGEAYDSIVGDKDPVPEQEDGRRAATPSPCGEEKKGFGKKLKEKFVGMFGGRGTGGQGKGTKTEEANGKHVSETSQAPDLAAGWTGADALTRPVPTGATSASGPSPAGGMIGNPELKDNHWGPGIGSGGAGVDDSEGVNDDGVIRIRGGGYDSDEELVLYPARGAKRKRGAEYESDEVLVLRLRGGGGDPGSELRKEEAAAESVLASGAKKSTGVTATGGSGAGGSIFKARKEEDDDDDEDDTDYDHGLKGVGTGKEPAEAHGVNTQETAKVKAPGIGDRIKEELEAFTGLFSAKKPEK